MNKIYLNFFVLIAVVLLVLCIVKVWNNHTLRETEDVKSTVSKDGAVRVADACGVIREAFLGSSNSLWNFQNCKAVSADHMEVNVWSPAELNADSKVSVYGPDQLPPATSATMCDVFFRPFDFIQKVDFIVTGSDKVTPVNLFKLDRSVCGAGLKSEVLKD
jgi:hypothetical protein